MEVGESHLGEVLRGQRRLSAPDVPEVGHSGRRGVKADVYDDGSIRDSLNRVDIGQKSPPLVSSFE
jgi:hypothetical protein